MPLNAAFSTAATIRIQRYFHGSGNCASPTLSLRHFAPKTKRPPRAKVMFVPTGPPPRNVAVIGGGLAGLAVTYHLLYSTSRRLRRRGTDPEALRVTIFDPALPGEGGASAAAAGLLHPFTPRAKKKAWQPIRSMDSAMRLLKVAQERTPESTLFKFPGLLRIALDAKMEEDFRIAARRFPREVEFLTADQVRERFPSARDTACAAFIKQAVVVNTQEYLKSLWKVCNDTERVIWRQEEVQDLLSLLPDSHTSTSASGDDPLTSDGLKFDTVVVCAGASIRALRELREVPLTPCRGQNLWLEAINSNVESPTPLISGKYIVPDYFQEDEADAATTGRDKVHRLLAGATFEYPSEHETELEFLRDKGEDAEVAMTQLKQPLKKLMPSILTEWKVTGGSVGIRALPPRSTDGSIPIACRLSEVREDINLWLFSGLGSRGLLHHAYLGRVLAHAIASGNEKLIPGDARRLPISTSMSTKATVTS